ncbi:MAG: tRNA1(Val) (adenine(37)-N6)-methyltransferase [Filifactoraceae bacterium]
MDINVKESERIDDIQIKNLKIIQDINGFCFGIDAVLLANFTKVKANKIGVDLGTGTGIIPLIIAGKSEVKRIFGVEIQDDVANMASRTVKLNGLEDRLKIINCNLKDVKFYLEGHSFDFVTSNPPYMNPMGLENQNEAVRISKQEVLCSLEDIFIAATYLLKQGGAFYMVHRPNRIIDMSIFSRKYKLELKEIRFVHPKVTKAPNICLMKFVKNGKPDLKILEPLYVYDEFGNYTDEINEIYSSDTLGVI